MTGCGYVCTVCEVKGLDSQTLLPCAFCASEIQSDIKLNEISIPNISYTEDSAWIESVHNKCNCGDL